MIPFGGKRFGSKVTPGFMLRGTMLCWELNTTILHTKRMLGPLNHLSSLASPFLTKIPSRIKAFSSIIVQSKVIPE